MPAFRHQQRHSRVDSPHGRRTFHQRDARESWTLGLTTRSPRAVGRAAELTLTEAGIAAVARRRRTPAPADRLTIMTTMLAAATGAMSIIALLALVLGWLGLSVGPHRWRPPHEQGAATSAGLVRKLG